MTKPISRPDRVRPKCVHNSIHEGQIRIFQNTFFQVCLLGANTCLGRVRPFRPKSSEHVGHFSHLCQFRTTKASLWAACWRWVPFQRNQRGFTFAKTSEIRCKCCIAVNFSTSCDATICHVITTIASKCPDCSQASVLRKELFISSKMFGLFPSISSPMFWKSSCRPKCD